MASAGLGSLPASAAVLSLDAMAAGHYDSNGGGPFPSYIVGLDGGFEFRNFFAFDLGGVSEKVSGAKLEVWSGTVRAGTSLDYSFYSVATKVEDLIIGRAPSMGNNGIFADLGTGLVLGGPFHLTESDGGKFLEFVLNDKAIDELNKVIDLKKKSVDEDLLWAIGGAIDTKTGVGYVFADTSLPSAASPFAIRSFIEAEVSPVRLFVETSSVAVPEPTTPALLALAALGLLLSRRRPS